MYATCIILHVQKQVERQEMSEKDRSQMQAKKDAEEKELKKQFDAMTTEEQKEYNEKLLGSYTELGGGGSGYDLYTQIFRNKRNGLFGQDPNFDGMNIANAEKDVWARVTPLEDGSGYFWEINFNLGRNEHQHPKYFFTVPKNQKITKVMVTH